MECPIQFRTPISGRPDDRARCQSRSSVFGKLQASLSSPGAPQVSNDVRMLLPILVGILVAKWVADAATHSLYHGLLEVKCVPWLPPEPSARRALDLVPVRYAMASPAVTLHERMGVEALRGILRDTRHSGFPVVRATPAGQVRGFQGLKGVCEVLGGPGHTVRADPGEPARQADGKRGLRVRRCLWACWRATT